MENDLAILKSLAQFPIKKPELSEIRVVQFLKDYNILQPLQLRFEAQDDLELFGTSNTYSLHRDAETERK